MTHILSPAGDPESLKAAVYAGADEVYFGLSSFNARAGAVNFDISAAAKAIEFCRVYGVGVDITLNTLLYGREFPRALEMVRELEKAAPPDAYIIQDPGLARELLCEFPGLTLHASTQMQIHGSYAAPVLKKLGFSRAVLAREMDENEIAAFAKCGLETEVFIHGAICVCRSGACLMSSMIGKRSGNRGECAYPCRMEYNGAYPLSLKDMCLARQIPRLLGMGVDALKIEGRMRSPEYVYGVTSVYRRLVDERRAATENEMKYLADLFSRSGFTSGYFTGSRGSAMFGVRTEEDKEKTRAAKVEIVPRMLPVKIEAFSKEGAPFSLALTSGGVRVEKTAAIREPAQNRETAARDAEKQLVKLGGTPFYAADVSVDIAPGGFYPVSALNALRRDAAAELQQALISAHAPVRKAKTPLPVREVQRAAGGLRIRFEGRQISENAFSSADTAVFPLENEKTWQKFARLCAQKISLLLPGFIFEEDVPIIKELLNKAKSAGITRVTLPNASFLPLCEGFVCEGGYELNCISPQTARTLYDLGFDSVCASPESKNASFCDFAVVYGRVRVMQTRNCIIKNLGRCTGGAGGTLRDRTGAQFPVSCAFSHGNIIYNSVPVWLLDKAVAASPELIFTDETAARQDEILVSLKTRSAPDVKFTRAYMG
ncbi:MAG: U32 family peptidase [Clostridia bacterium]|nr:U32 family peptidase [Clostridia bacterium]